jgi:CubicO group peptidase (beta-lactamase class C family)
MMMKPFLARTWCRWLVTQLCALTACSLAAAQPSSSLAGAAFQQLATQYGVCVLAFARLKDGAVESVQTATGCESAQVPEAPIVFQAASLGKPVFAYAVLKLVAQGRLDLDKPLIGYLPQGYVHVQNPFAEAQSIITDEVTAPELRAVTARHVLQHSSGLPNWSRQALRFESSPGARWRYSGEGYGLLQRVVEAIADQPLQDLMTKLVFEPLAMSHSAYQWDSRFEAHLAVGTSNKGVPLRRGNFRTALVASTLYTTADDYAKFLAAVLADAHLLKQTNEAPFMVDKRLGLLWGLGWGIASMDAEQFIWHWGNNPGYRAFVIASLKSADGLVVLTNSDNGMRLAQALVKAQLPAAQEVFGFRMLRE